jgi:hypothetical protein
MPFAMQQLNARMAGPLAGRTAAPLAAPPTPFVAARNQGQPRQQRRRQQRLAAAAADPAAAGGAGGSPAEPRGGRSTYRPNSYIELITDAVQSIKAGMAEGLTRMEVDFPAVAGVDGGRTSAAAARPCPASTFLAHCVCCEAPPHLHSSDHSLCACRLQGLLRPVH